MRSDEAIDPEFLAIAAPRAALTLPFDASAPEPARRNRRELFGPVSGRMAAHVQTERRDDLAFFTPDNARPGYILYLHGGGWALCDTVTHAAVMTDLAATSGLTVAGADYPLAPEHPYPQALDMLAETAARLAAENPGAPLVLAGDSAGANLALGLAARLRDAGSVRVDALVLFYGCYRRLFDTESHRLYGGGEFGLTTEGMRVYWDLYLASHSAPAYGDLTKLDVNGLPPCFIGAAALDCLRDDSTWLADRLSAAGIPNAHQSVPAVPHGFLHYTGLYPPAFGLLDAAGQWLRDRDRQP
ncbi:alpha/beta hydrolase [Paracoccus caeni]|uniref:Alpha/beta hydrolase n=1 Tax=Paracoccus caeni TaxID=657651 RepID=A0A934SGZ7_9RHOB|nr:alpha/beta hydrolase fold domain-containing protein [Paracoccus caeni]MBK4217677.1 alpha/beta hydrolase [Paracoccus caeni]